jgi:hypothetical protein
MSRIRRLIACVVFWMCAPAWALLPTVDTYGPWNTYNWDSSQFGARPPWWMTYSTAAEGLAALRALTEEKMVSLVVRGYLGPMGCWTYTPFTFNRDLGGQGVYLVVGENLGGCAGGGLAVQARVTKACPANSTQVPGGCECKPGYLEDRARGSCAATPEPAFAQTCKAG